MTHAFLSEKQPSIRNHTTSQVYFIVGSTSQERKNKRDSQALPGPWVDRSSHGHITEHWFGTGLEQAEIALEKRRDEKVFRISNDRYETHEHRNIDFKIYRVVELVVHTYEEVK